MYSVADIESETNPTIITEKVYKLTNLIKSIPEYYNEDTRKGIYSSLLFAIPTVVDANCNYVKDTTSIPSVLAEVIANLSNIDLNNATLSLNVLIEKLFQSHYGVGVYSAAAKQVINELMKEYANKEIEYYWDILHPDEKEKIESQIHQIEGEIEGLKIHLDNLPEAKLIEALSKDIKENSDKEASLGLFKGKEKAMLRNKVRELMKELRKQNEELEKTSAPIYEEIDCKEKEIEELKKPFDVLRTFDIPMGAVVIEGALDRIFAVYN